MIVFDCEGAASRFEFTYWAVLIQDQRGRYAGPADRRDCLDDLSPFRKVVGDPDGLGAVTCAVNDFPVCRSSASRRLSDCQSTEANKEIVELIYFVPGGVENGDIVATRFRPLDPAIYPR
jgi:hypothetical protein